MKKRTTIDIVISKGKEFNALEDAVAKMRAGLPEEAGPEVFRRIKAFVTPFAQGAVLAQIALTDYRVRDALYALSIAQEQRIKLESLLDALDLHEQFVGLKFPFTEPDMVTMAPGIVASLASKYSVSARIIIEYVAANGELPAFCRKDFKPKVRKAPKRRSKRKQS